MEKRFHLYGANPTSKVWFMKRFSRVDCFSGVDQNKYSLDMFTSSSLTVNLTEGAAACVALYLKCYVTRVKIYDNTSLQALFIFLFFFFNHLASHKHLHTEKRTVSTQTN